MRDKVTLCLTDLRNGSLIYTHQVGDALLARTVRVLVGLDDYGMVPDSNFMTSPRQEAFTCGIDFLQSIIGVFICLTAEEQRHLMSIVSAGKGHIKATLIITI